MVNIPTIVIFLGDGAHGIVAYPQKRPQQKRCRPWYRTSRSLMPPHATWVLRGFNSCARPGRRITTLKCGIAPFRKHGNEQLLYRYIFIFLAIWQIDNRYLTSHDDILRRWPQGSPLFIYFQGADSLRDLCFDRLGVFRTPILLKSQGEIYTNVSPSIWAGSCGTIAKCSSLFGGLKSGKQKDTTGGSHRLKKVDLSKLFVDLTATSLGNTLGIGVTIPFYGLNSGQWIIEIYPES